MRVRDNRWGGHRTRTNSCVHRHSWKYCEPSIREAVLRISLVVQISLFFSIWRLTFGGAEHVARCLRDFAACSPHDSAHCGATSTRVWSSRILKKEDNVVSAPMVQAQRPFRHSRATSSSRCLPLSTLPLLLRPSDHIRLQSSNKTPRGNQVDPTSDLGPRS